MRILPAYFLALLVICISTAASADYLKADKLFYDKVNDIYIAEGKVEILDNQKILFADEVTYFKNDDRVIAKGDVVLLEPNGEVFFGDELELQDNFRKGIVENFTGKLQENVTLMAVRANRLSEEQYRLEDAIYTPCKIHYEKNKNPEWQLKASKVDLDNEEQVIKYKHVFFQYGRVPIFYSPFLSHPTPNADRKSGFLTPDYGIISDVGTFIAIPYYFNIAPDKDFTLTTMLTTLKAPIFKAEYRHILENGDYKFNGSATYPRNFKRENGEFLPGRKFRGHIEGKGDFQIGENLYNGFFVKRASDDSYLRTYGISDENYLTSNIYLEHFDDRDLSYLDTYSFQGLLDTDDPATSPLILPVGNSHIESERLIGNSYFSADSNVLVLYRDEGVQSRRLSSKLAYDLPTILDSGQQINLGASLRADLYSVDNVQSKNSPTNPSLNFDGVVSRIIPEVRVDWNYPLINEFDMGNVIVEPIVNFIYSPYGGNADKIPNEDSLDVELSDDNLFNGNRFAGLDRVETGPRINVGLSSTYYTYQDTYVNVLFGQVYRFKKDSNFDVGSGLDSRSSDYVGRLYARPNKYIDVNYRFRIDQEELRVKRSELSAFLTYDPMRLEVNYASINDPHHNINEIPKRREEILASLYIDLNEYWTININGRRNLAEQGMIKTGWHLDYHSDCVKLLLTYEKDHTRDKNLSNQEKFYITLDLKNLLSLNL